MLELWHLASDKRAWEGPALEKNSWLGCSAQKYHPCIPASTLLGKEQALPCALRERDSTRGCLPAHGHSSRLPVSTFLKLLPHIRCNYMLDPVITCSKSLDKR